VSTKFCTELLSCIFDLLNRKILELSADRTKIESLKATIAKTF